MSMPLNEDESNNFIKTIEDDNEKTSKLNPTPTWNKLTKINKKNKLYHYAEIYAVENKYNASDLKMLKMFFLKTLDKGKLNKLKEVNYNVETQEIVSIPGLFFNQTTKNFTLRNMDPKHVSTLKSLPSPKNAKVKIE
jgi:hypothetical protein|tara:strand:- start:3112 stop:3522 length:411 start_codon:yes stop_codon:yes gene_type:complete